MEGRELAVIDTNLLVRYLTGDDAVKAGAVRRLLVRAGKGEVRLLVPSVVIAELVWVLQSFYKLERSEIVSLLNAILHTAGLDVGERGLVTRAVGLYGATAVDFIDAWVAAYAQTSGARAIYTFDRKHFRDCEAVEVIHP